MIHLPHEPIPEWESPDASAWREFLSSVTGRKLFPLLLLDRPKLTGATVEQTALNAKALEGFYGAVNFLSSLAATTVTQAETPTATAYPPLESDDHWDGPKLHDPTTETPS